MHDIDKSNEAIPENPPIVQEEQDATAPETAVSDGQQPFDKLSEENQRARDQLLRLAAEFDNYRKRNERDAAQWIQNANMELVGKLLPSLDDLERILTSGEKAADAAALLEGLRLFQKNLLKILQEEGLQAMEVLGREFDPEFHDALLHVEVEGAEANSIIEEHKKGYLFKERILRHAQVIVSK